MNTTNNFDEEEDQENNPHLYNTKKVRIGEAVKVYHDKKWILAVIEEEISPTYIRVIIHNLNELRLTVKKHDARTPDFDPENHPGDIL
jgi:hypothetical protein